MHYWRRQEALTGVRGRAASAFAPLSLARSPRRRGKVKTPQRRVTDDDAVTCDLGTQKVGKSRKAAKTRPTMQI